MTKKNIEFRESLASVMPLAPSIRGLSDDQMRVGLVVIWVSAAILAGVGMGMWISALTSANRTAPGFPVAMAKVAVIAIPGVPALVSTTLPKPSDKPPFGAALSINQAAGGNPIQTVSLAVYQATAGFDALTPGLIQEDRVQGNIGTKPVR